MGLYGRGGPLTFGDHEIFKKITGVQIYPGELKYTRLLMCNVYVYLPPFCQKHPNPNVLGIGQN